MMNSAKSKLDDELLKIACGDWQPEYNDEIGNFLVGRGEFSDYRIMARKDINYYALEFKGGIQRGVFSIVMVNADIDTLKLEAILCCRLRLSAPTSQSHTEGLTGYLSGVW